MKALLFSAALLVPFLAQAKDMNDYEPNGWETIVNCGTGDALDGADVIWGASKKLYVSLTSLDDSQPAKFYYTESGAKAVEALKQIRAGKQVQLVLRSDESDDFGGATSNAALMSLKASKKGDTNYNSTLAEGGAVFSLFCNLKQGE